MEIKIVLWRSNHRTVRIETESHVLVITKTTDTNAHVWTRSAFRLDVAEAKDMAKALELAAKVAGYLDELKPDEARDAILGLPTTPYNGPWPTPRAGRTEN